MRNDDNEHEKYPFLGIKHEKRMRNAYIRKHFSFPISVYFNQLTNNHENMRNENENSSSRGRSMGAITYKEIINSLYNANIIIINKDKTITLSPEIATLVL